MASRKKLKVAIIGVGGISGIHHSGYSKCEDAELWAICDIKPDVLKEKSEKYGVPAERCFLDHRDLLKLKEIEAVSVCTPNKSHCEITVNSLKAGKHVLCEKPIAMDARQGRKMVDAAAKAGRILQIGLMQRFRTDANYVKGLVDDGTLGEIYYARCRAVRRRGVPSWGVFGQLEENGGGGLIDIGVHMIDLTWYVMGKPQPVSVSGQTYRTIGNTPGHWGIFGKWDHKTYTVEDFASGYVRFANGATMSIECGFIANLEADCENFHVVGTKGGAGVSPLNLQLEVGGHLCDATPRDMITVDLHGNPGNLVNHELEIMHFVDCILHNKPTRVPGHEVVWIQKIIDGLYQSAKAGKELAIR
jgi:predicted dehydrogenase